MPRQGCKTETRHWPAEARERASILAGKESLKDKAQWEPVPDRPPEVDLINIRVGEGKERDKARWALVEARQLVGVSINIPARDRKPARQAPEPRGWDLKTRGGAYK